MQNLSCGCTRCTLPSGRLRLRLTGERQDAWEWSKLEVEASTPQPTPRDFAGMVDLPDGRLLLFGGLDAAERRLEDTWIFDVARCGRLHVVGLHRALRGTEARDVQPNLSRR